MTMQSRSELGQTARQQPKWLWLTAALCLVLICVASTVQVCHTHTALSSARNDSRQSAPAPDQCPLCVAMHSALPATANTTFVPVLQVQAALFRSAEVQFFERWSFELFGRPPPVMQSIT